jgi:hypothetical protein
MLKYGQRYVDKVAEYYEHRYRRQQIAAFGEQEAMSVIERLNGSIESTYSDLIEFRRDLSYIPTK